MSRGLIWAMRATKDLMRYTNIRLPRRWRALWDRLERAVFDMIAKWGKLDRASQYHLKLKAMPMNASWKTNRYLNGNDRLECAPLNHARFYAGPDICSAPPSPPSPPPPRSSSSRHISAPAIAAIVLVSNISALVWFSCCISLLWKRFRLTLVREPPSWIRSNTNTGEYE